MVLAIEKNDLKLFVALGGASSADLNFSMSTDGVFPLLIATAKGLYEMVDYMLTNKNTDVNMRDKNGVNAFWIACWFGNVDIMRLLIANKCDPNVTNENGSNALHIAVK